MTTRIAPARSIPRPRCSHASLDAVVGGVEGTVIAAGGRNILFTPDPNAPFWIEDDGTRRNEPFTQKENGFTITGMQNYYPTKTVGDQVFPAWRIYSDVTVTGDGVEIKYPLMEFPFGMSGGARFTEDDEPEHQNAPDLGQTLDAAPINDPYVAPADETDPEAYGYFGDQGIDAGGF